MAAQLTNAGKRRARTLFGYVRDGGMCCVCEVCGGDVYIPPFTHPFIHRCVHTHIHTHTHVYTHPPEGLPHGGDGEDDVQVGAGALRQEGQQRRGGVGDALLWWCSGGVVLV